MPNPAQRFPDAAAAVSESSNLSRQLVAEAAVLILESYWFYIDGRDPASKRVFASIVDTYKSRVGLKTTEDAVPQVVLPVSGG